MSERKNGSALFTKIGTETPVVAYAARLCSATTTAICRIPALAAALRSITAFTAPPNDPQQPDTLDGPHRAKRPDPTHKTKSQNGGNKMEIIKQYRDGNERHDIVCLAGETLFENWYSVLEDSCCLRHPSSTAGYFHSLDEAEAAMHKHRPAAVEISEEA